MWGQGAQATPPLLQRPRQPCPPNPVQVRPAPPPQPGWPPPRLQAALGRCGGRGALWLGPRSRESLSRGSAAAAMGRGAPGAGGGAGARPWAQVQVRGRDGTRGGDGRGGGRRSRCPVSPRPSSPAPPQLGPWSWRGCRTVPLDALRTRCLCDRLSTFAILAQLSADAVRPRRDARAGGGAEGTSGRTVASGPARAQRAELATSWEGSVCPAGPGAWPQGLGLWRGWVRAEWVAMWSWGLAGGTGLGPQE